jgi:hypothetical protein
MAANTLIMTFESISFLSWGGCHMSTWVLHDAENCITDMLWTQATHKLPHVFLSKQAVIIQTVCVSRCDCMLTLLAVLLSRCFDKLCSSRLLLFKCKPICYKP